MPDASSYPPGFNYRHPVYLRARDEAFARSRGTCQECGQQPADQVESPRPDWVKYQGSMMISFSDAPRVIRHEIKAVR